MNYYKLNENDYFDNENGYFIIFINGDEKEIKTNLTISDDIVDWNCYLTGVEYVSGTNTYECYYVKH